MVRRIERVYEKKKPRSRYYLRKLGLRRDEVADNYAILRPRRLLKFWWQRRKYGFDERITWSLSSGMAQLMYERLLMYRDIGGQMIDLEAPHHNVEWKGETHTLLEAINLMIGKLGVFILFEFTEEEVALDAFDDFLDLYKLCYSSLWW